MTARGEWASQRVTYIAPAADNDAASNRNPTHAQGRGMRISLRIPLPCARHMKREHSIAPHSNACGTVFARERLNTGPHAVWR